MPAIWLDHEPFDEQRAIFDEAYRLSIRYQYAWENSPCKYAFFMHNDIYVKGDIVGKMLSAIGTNAGIGEIGQCYLCPAAEFKLCGGDHYTEFIPKYHQLMYLYNTNMDYKKRRAYNLGLDQSFWQKPWPLPECRLNEWCALVNLELTRPLTVPLGKGVPFGAFYDSGSKIGETWDDIVNLDTAV